MLTFFSPPNPYRGGEGLKKRLSLKLHVIFAHFLEYFELTGHTLFHPIVNDMTTSFLNTEQLLTGTRMKLQGNKKRSLDIA